MTRTYERRTPHGVRGLKSIPTGNKTAILCRTPHGVRGLKSLINNIFQSYNPSHPAWGAWIEIGILSSSFSASSGSSHPAWGAWIEIKVHSVEDMLKLVAPRMGCVD